MSFRAPASPRAGAPMVINDNAYNNSRSRTRTRSILPGQQPSSGPTTPSDLPKPTVIHEEHDDTDVTDQFSDLPPPTCTNVIPLVSSLRPTLSSDDSLSSLATPTSPTPPASNGLSNQLSGKSSSHNDEIIGSSGLLYGQTFQKSTFHRPISQQPPHSQIPPEMASIEIDDDDLPPEATPSGSSAPKSSFFRRAFEKFGKTNAIENSQTPPISQNPNDQTSAHTSLHSTPQQGPLNTPKESRFSTLVPTPRAQPKDSFEHAANSPVFLGSRKQTIQNLQNGHNFGTMAHRRQSNTTDFVRIARVWIDPALFTEESAHHISPQVPVLQPICLTVHFRPTNDQFQDKQQILRATLTKMHLSSETINIPSPLLKSPNSQRTTQRNDSIDNSNSFTSSKRFNIHQTVSTVGKNPVHSALVVGGEDFLSILNGDKSLSDELVKPNKEEECDSVVASFDEKPFIPQLAHQTSTGSRFLSRKSVRFNENTPKSSHTTSQSELSLSPITRQTYDLNSFALVPYTSPQATTDASSRRASQLITHQLTTINTQSSLADKTTNPNESSSLRKMSISNHGFILEYQLIRTYTTSLEVATIEDYGLEEGDESADKEFLLERSSEDKEFLLSTRSPRSVVPQTRVIGNASPELQDLTDSSSSTEKDIVNISTSAHISSKRNYESVVSRTSSIGSPPPPPSLSAQPHDSSRTASIPPPPPSHHSSINLDEQSIPPPPPNSIDAEIETNSPVLSGKKPHRRESMPSDIQVFIDHSNINDAMGQSNIASIQENDISANILNSCSEQFPQKQFIDQYQTMYKDYETNVHHVVTDTPVLSLDLVKVNKIKRKLPRTLTFTPTTFITTVTHKFDCHLDPAVVARQQLQQRTMSTTALSQQQLNEFNKNKDILSTPNTNENSSTLTNTNTEQPDNPTHPTLDTFDTLLHQRNSTNSDLFSLLQNSLICPAVPSPSNKTTSNTDTQSSSHFSSLDTHTTSSLVLPKNSIPENSSLPHSNSNSTGGFTANNNTNIEHPSIYELTTQINAFDPRYQQTRNDVEFIPANQQSDQCFRCGEATEKTFTCPLSEVLYASVVHIHSLRLSFATRTSQLYLTDNAPLVVTCINAYLSMVHQKNMTSPASDLNKIVASHRILASGAVRYICVKLYALQNGAELPELYNAQKIMLNSHLLVSSHFSNLGRKIVLSEYIPHVINTQHIARLYPLLHQYILNKGKLDFNPNTAQTTYNQDNKDPTLLSQLHNLQAAQLEDPPFTAPEHIINQTNVVADNIFNLFMTGGSTYQSPTLSQDTMNMYLKLHQYNSIMLTNSMLIPNSSGVSSCVTGPDAVFNQRDCSDDEAPEGTQQQYNDDLLLMSSMSTLGPNSIAATKDSAPPGVSKIQCGEFGTNIRVDRTFIDFNNQFTPEVIQYLSSSNNAAYQTQCQQQLLLQTTSGSPTSSPHLQPSLPPTTHSTTTPNHSARYVNLQVSISGENLATTSNQPQPSPRSMNTFRSLLNPTSTLNPALPTGPITVPFQFANQSLFNQLLGLTITPGLWRMILKVMLLCFQPHIFKRVITTIPLIHNNHYATCVTWQKVFDQYKTIYDKYVKDTLSKIKYRTDQQTGFNTNTVYVKNAVFDNTKLIVDDEYQTTGGPVSMSTSNTILSALNVSDELFDIHDPTHVFNTQYMPKALKEQMAKIEQEGSVLLYRTKQLTSALAQYVSQNYHEELFSLAGLPFTTVYQFNQTYQTPVPQWVLHPDILTVENDYDTMVSHATQYAIELTIAPPLTPLIDTYLQLKCHAKDSKLYNICLYHTSFKKKQSDYNIPIHLQSPDKWNTPISTLKQITTVNTPIERLQCLLTTCKYIYHTYKLLIQTRTDAYSVVKQHVLMGVYPDDIEGFSNESEVNLHNYSQITKIVNPSDELIGRIKSYSVQKWKDSHRGQEPSAADILANQTFISDNIIPTVEQVNDARYGILVRKLDQTDHSKVLHQYILIKDDIGPSSPLCADDFFPIFVYVVMHAKIPKLETIKQYIGSMAPRVSLTGEVGYYFTVFEATLDYIEAMNAQ